MRATEIDDANPEDTTNDIVVNSCYQWIVEHGSSRSNVIGDSRNIRRIVEESELVTIEFRSICNVDVYRKLGAGSQRPISPSNIVARVNAAPNTDDRGGLSMDNGIPN